MRNLVFTGDVAAQGLGLTGGQTHRMLAGNGCPERLAEAGPGQRRIGSSGVALDRCRRVVSTERGQHVLFETVGTQGNDQCFVYLPRLRSEEHTSELQSLMRISYAVFCL